MAHLSLSLLGGFNITLNGQAVTTLGTDKVRALLAYLAVESDRPHRRAALAGMFWPEMPQEKAAHNLRQSLLRLRRALHGDKVSASPRSSFLLLTGQVVQFNPLSDSNLDVADFLELVRAHRQHQHTEADGCKVCIDWLRQAIGLYRGDLLAGFTARDSLPFEEWQVVQREALHRQAVEALGRLANYYERRGEPSQVLEYAHRLVALEPWQEQAQLQVMEALAQSGQEGAALERYVSFSRMLAQDFGIAPSPEITALYERIRSRQFGRQSVLDSPAAQREVLIGIPALPDERRQVTALLCQWQSTTDNGDLDEMLDGLTRFERFFSGVIERYGGRQQPRVGSEFLAYFGYPVAQENAAWHAIKAALALSVTPRANEHFRLGIHTGMMVSHRNELVGNVPDLARDCLRLAELDSVLITADTERLVRGKFFCLPMGVAGPIEHTLNYRVLREDAASIHPAWFAHRPRLAQLVGRADEMKQLAACLDRIHEEQGQIITVCGEPGIGKTRLTREFKQICPWPAVWLESRCSPSFQNTSLHPIVDLLEQLLGFEAGDDDKVKREKLTRILAHSELATSDTIWLFSLLLGLHDDTPAPQTITEDRRERMREVCIALLQRAAAQQPLMLLIEDLQWADPTTITWISRSLDALAAARCVLWLNWRPEFVAPWRPRPNLLSLNLEPLDPQQAASLVSDMVGWEMLPDEVCQQIVKQADGIPLFLEELTQTILVQSVLDDAAPLNVAQVPATLRDSLTVRLDRTGAARVTAQWAAVIGREFAYPVLREAVPFPEQRLQDDLAILLASGLIVSRDEVPYHTYAFKHTLIQEAAYDSLLKRTRQDYHGRSAQILADRFPYIAETQPEILAEHYSRAGMSAQAADQWLRAGERAIAQGATLEARTFLDRALAALNPIDLERHWQVLLSREAVLDLREERAAQHEDIETLLELADTLNDDSRRAQALLRQAIYANRMNDFQFMLQTSDTAITVAARARNAELQVQALHKKVVALSRLERWEIAHPIVEEVLAELAGITNDVVIGNALADLALYFNDVGDAARALLLRLRGLEIARRVGDRGLEIRHLANIGMNYARLGLYAEARAVLEAGLALTEALGDRYWELIYWFDLCYVLWCRGDRDGARTMGERALQELRASGYRPLAVATCLSYLGLMLENAADYTTAAAYLTESRTLYAAGGWHGPGMEVQAVEARCLLALGRREEARQLASEVWTFLSTHGTVTMDFPSRVYLCVADVVAQVPTPDITEREVLEAGYAVLMQKAEKIEDTEWRRSLLEDELSSRDLIARWKT